MQLVLLATVALSATLVAGFSGRDFNLENPVHYDFACRKLYPKHDPFEREPTSGPYEMTTEVQGKNVKVTISGPSFKGFILQAKGATGSFSSSEAIYVVPCDKAGARDVPWATIRHRGVRAGRNTFQATWTPDQGAGTVTFEGTVVQEYTQFYKLGPKTVNF